MDGRESGKHAGRRPVGRHGDLEQRSERNGGYGGKDWLCGRGADRLYRPGRTDNAPAVRRFSSGHEQDEQEI